MHQARQLGGQDHQQAEAIENSLGSQPIQDMTPPTIGPRTQPHLQVGYHSTRTTGNHTHTPHKHTHTASHLTQPHPPVSQH